MGVFKLSYQESPWTGGSHEKSSFYPGMISVNVAQVPRLRSVGKSFFDHMGGQNLRPVHRSSSLAATPTSRMA